MRTLAMAATTATVTCILASGAHEPSPEFRLRSTALAGPAPFGLVARQQIDWCGAGQPTVFNRTPEADLSSIRQVHVSYVVPADVPDRFGSRAALIATDVAAIDAWWRGQDAARTIRFDRFAFVGCTTTFGALDIGFLRLPRPGAAYVGEEGIDELLRDLTELERLAFHKHLIYYDGPNVLDESVCGATKTNRFTRNADGVEAVSFFWLGSLCAIDLGAGGLAASVAVHELIHNLGAISEGSPHECAPPNRGHVCDSKADILTPFATSETRLATQLLDVNRDDYYESPDPTFDVRFRSVWLSHLPQLPVSVTATGSAGTVRMDTPSLFDCGRSCTLEVDTESPLTFVATPGAGARFVGWSGACTGASSCSVRVTAETAITARFGPAPRIRLTVVVTGRGRVVSSPPGISCPSRCTATFASGGKVRLRPLPSAGHRFARWGGACRGTGPCIVIADRARTVRAAFRRP